MVLEEYSPIKAWRVYKKIPLEVIAMRMGITQVELSRLEEQNADCDRAILLKVADALGIMVDQIDNI